MILKLEETKEFLRVDSNDDDNYIEDLISSSELYLKNATGKIFDNTNPLAKLFCKVLISDWYDNRGYMEDSKISNKVRYTVQSIIVQLSYCGGV